MNEYTRLRNTHDRAVILAQLVNADARALAVTIGLGDQTRTLLYARNYDQSRAELWKLVGTAPEDEASEA